MNVRPATLAAWLLVMLSSADARADGGTLRLRERAGNYRIAVFTSPALLRAGVVDVSVLVQDAATGQHLPQARVTVRLIEQQDERETLEQPATVGAATNKLFHAAEFELPRPGRWEVEVTVAGAPVVRCELDVAEPLPRLLEMWPWIAWPAGVIVLFGIHQRLIRRAADESPR